MKTIEYNTIDKSTWGQGPWMSEPDKKQFVDAATGLPCLAVRHTDSGHWCGYVGVPEGHPFFKVEYDEVRAIDGEWIEVHGGLTFASMCQPGEDESRGVCHLPGAGEPDHVWWLGFDCAHSGDRSPAHKSSFNFGEDTYKTLRYVEIECRALARQLAQPSL